MTPELLFIGYNLEIDLGEQVISQQQTYAFSAMPFVGRQRELADITRLLADPTCRLLSLVGPGGTGKTRLALQAAQSTPLNVHVAFLQPLASSEFLLSGIADALDFQFYPGGEPKQQLLDFLRDKTLLLVLDNLEHLLDGVGLLSDILHAAPQVRMLTTSRERLNLLEEWTLELGGLDYPASENEANIEAYTAGQLFLQQARRVHIGFELTPEQARAILRICQLVDGMPLAIELAAAWVRALPCEEIAREIKRGLDILETPARNIEPRHRNMRAAFEPTWKRLSEEQQRVFMRLSVFRGGLTRAAAEQVAGASLRTLSELVDKSLLRVNHSGRYDIHELLRQYGQEKLVETQQLEQAYDAHCRYFAQYVHQRTEDLKGRRQVAALQEIQADFENIRAAWTWAADHCKEGPIAQMIDGLWIYLDHGSHTIEQLPLFRYAERRFAPGDGEDGSPTWRRLLARAFSDDASADAVSTARLETALELARQHQHLADTAFCLTKLGKIAYINEELEKVYLYLKQSLSLYEQLGDMYEAAAILFELGRVSNTWENFSSYMGAALRLRQKNGDQVGLAWSLAVAALDAGRAGRFDEAERLWLERIAVGREIGNQHLVALGYAQICNKVYFFQGRFDEAYAAANKGLTLGRESNHSDAVDGP